MKKIKSKVKLSIAINKNIKIYLEENFQNKSKYIESLIFEDLLKNGKIDKNEYYM